MYFLTFSNIYTDQKQFIKYEDQQTRTPNEKLPLTKNCAIMQTYTYIKAHKYNTFKEKQTNLLLLLS